MNRKPDSRAPLFSLPAEQQAMAEGWLCEENVSYAVFQKRCAKEFGRTPSNGAITDFYRAAQRKRNLAEILRSASQANVVVKELGKDSAETSKAIMQIAGQMAFNSALINARGEKPDLDTLRKVMDVYLSTRKDDREAGKFYLEREKWEFDVARTCLHHHAELQKISANSALDEDARILAIRHRLFGPNLPK
jgi:hypothetical protein